MPWLRSGDNAATYPPLLALGMAAGGDERTLNEVSGWLWRCAMQSAGHLTDGQIDAGTAYLMGGARTPVLVDAAVGAGLLEPVAGAAPARWQIIDDPEFLHIRSRASVEFDRQRDRDRKNPALTAPVRLRDGDACRYCGLVVNFRARTGARAGTYDHREPGQAATVETYVVACKLCNDKMRDGERLPLLPAPAEPYYHPATLAWLHEHGHRPAGYRSEPARAGDGLTPGGHRAPARPAPAAVDPFARADEALHGGRWEVPPAGARQEPLAAQGGIPDGTGRDGTGRDGTGAAPPQGAGGPRRSRRGRRGRRGAGGR